MKVQELLNNPERWTKGDMARDINKKPTPHDSSNAVCWCLAGAIWNCYGNDGYVATIRKVTDSLGLKPDRIGCSLTAWNDDPSRTFKEVQALVKELDL